MQCAFALPCFTCKTPFVSADQESMSKPSWIKCSSILSQLPGISETSAQLEVSQESLHITAVRLSGEGSQLPATKGSPSFPAWTHGRLCEAMQPWAEEMFFCCARPVLISAQNPTHKSVVFLQHPWRLLCTEASSFRHSSACSQVTDWCHVNSAGFSVSGAAGFMWSCCAAICFKLYVPWKLNYHVLARWDCLGLEQHDHSPLSFLHLEKGIWSVNYSKSLQGGSFSFRNAVHIPSCVWLG